jgi:hypothetical protein
MTENKYLTKWIYETSARFLAMRGTACSIDMYSRRRKRNDETTNLNHANHINPINHGSDNREKTILNRKQFF